MFFKTTKKKLCIVLGALLVSVLLGGISFFWNSTQNSPDLSKYYLTGKFGKLPRPDGYGKTVDLIHRFYLFDGLAYLRYWGERDYQKPIPDGTHRLKTKSGSEIEFQARNGVVDQLKVLSNIHEFKENEPILKDRCKIASIYIDFLYIHGKTEKIKFTDFDVRGCWEFSKTNRLNRFGVIQNSKGEKFAIGLDPHWFPSKIKGLWHFNTIPIDVKKSGFARYMVKVANNKKHANIVLDGCKVITFGEAIQWW
ncbi:MAG: hypothetical protein HRT90_12200 [Candidatus Margulisbacteria bacterium]|nr:hypothetical protein [Candidatus Margulisiibacteriota bacterium]